MREGEDQYLSLWQINKRYVVFPPILFLNYVVLDEKK
jgi:hypothetical protein